MAFEKVYSCNLPSHVCNGSRSTKCRRREQISHSNNSIIIPFPSSLNIRNPYFLFSFTLFESQKAYKLLEEQESSNKL